MPKADSAAALSWRVEEVCFSAFPSLQQAYLGGWLWRFSPGGPRRAANSINPLRPDCDGSPALLDAAAALYRRRGMPVLFRLTTLLAPGIDAALAARGYRLEGESRVIYGEIGGVAALPDAAVRLAPAPGRAWFAAMAELQGHTPRQAAIYRRILRSIAVPAAFALLRVDGAPAALAYAVLSDGLLCYESVITAGAFRRRGLARRVIGALAAWGRDNGATGACLQVEAANTAGRALYDGFGLTRELHRYHYRRAP